MYCGYEFSPIGLLKEKSVNNLIGQFIAIHVYPIERKMYRSISSGQINVTQIYGYPGINCLTRNKSAIGWLIGAADILRDSTNHD